MLLLDTSMSMNWGVSGSDDTPRRVLVCDALRGVVAALAEHDAQGADEEGGGGLRTVTFTSIHHVPHVEDIGDVNPANFSAKWAGIQWRGSTVIRPGFDKLFQVYMDEFGARPPAERPKLVAIVITDGEAEDTEAFAAALATVGAGVYVALAIIGFGDEHDAAMRAYLSVAARNSHVRVVSLAAVSDSALVTRTVMSMLGVKRAVQAEVVPTAPPDEPQVVVV